MTIDDLFTQLTYGELKQQSIGGFEEGGVQEGNYRELVSHLNLALLAVYTRFPLIEKKWSLEPVEGQTLYTVESDLLRINAAFDSEGCEIPLNDENADLSIITPSFNTVELPEEVTKPVLVHYRAKPEKVVAPSADATEEELAAFLVQEVALPEALVEPLCSYIEYRVCKAIGGELSLAQATVALQNYERLCMDVERRNVLQTSRTATNVKSGLGGWV